MESISDLTIANNVDGLIKKLEGKTRVDLWNSRIGDAGVKVLITALKSNSNQHLTPATPIFARGMYLS